MTKKQADHGNLRFGSDRQLLSRDQVETVRRLWEAEAHSLAEIAAEIDVGVWVLKARFEDQLQDLAKRGQGWRPRARPPESYRDPTPDEIRVRAAEVRRSWGPERYLPGYVPEDRRYGRALDTFR